MIALKPIQTLNTLKPHFKKQISKNITIKPPVRNRVQPKALPHDIITYAEFQLVSWVLPMTIAGRLMDMNYEDIAKNLIFLALFKTFFLDTNLFS